MGPHGATCAVNFGQTFVPPISRHMNCSNNKLFIIFFAIYFLLQITSSSTSGSELCYPSPCRLFVDFTASMARQVILSIAYRIDVLPENDPYVVGAENMMQSFAFSTTKEATLLDMIPWCICCHIIWKPEN